MLRKMIKLLILVAAVGGPIMYYKAPNIWANVKETCSNFFSGGEEDPKTSEEGVGSIPGLTPMGTPKIPVHEGAIVDLSEVFRFDGVTIDWIMNHWPRATTGLSRPDYQGYRVPLVTGTRLDDLAGSLTYYFYSNQQVQTITFTGSTGDTTRLVRMLTQKYGFQRQLVKDAGLFLYVVPDKNGKFRSTLWIRPAAVLRTDAPYNRFQVEMFLQRPDNEKKVATKPSLPNWNK